MKTNFRIPRTWRRVGLCLSIVAALAGCGGGTTYSATQPLTVSYILAPVNGGSCSLLDSGGKTVAGPTTTRAGVANFDALPTSTGTVQVVCQDGTYVDEATGTTLAAPRLRSFMFLGQGSTAATVTPLTEIAVSLLGNRSPDAAFKPVLAAVASAFGLNGMDLATQVPNVISQSDVLDDAASRYGSVLAALSQLGVRGTLGKTAQAVLTRLIANFDADGEVIAALPQDEYASAVEDMVDNPRLKARFSTTTAGTVLRSLFDASEADSPLAVVQYVNTDFSLTRYDVSTTVVAGSRNTIAVVGTGFSLGLKVTLGGAACTVGNLRQLDTETSSDDEMLYADCPAPTVGTSTLVVTDRSTVVARIPMTVISAAQAAQRAEGRLTARAAPSAGGGSAHIYGTVTAEAPTISPVDVVDANGVTYAAGAHQYGKPRLFTVKGVVVELLDANSGAVLLSTNTDGDGRYAFLGADAGRRVVVRAKAQLIKTRAAGSTRGAQWDLSIRDNTSKTQPRALYTLDSTVVTPAPGDNFLDLTAAHGFSPDGRVIGVRQSAPFAILEVIYSAATKLEETQPDITIPSINIYWSTRNSTVKGNVSVGEIETSHYQSAGNLPGVFILGLADSDTDEFDQGVIGHELGHFLQDVLAYSDNPGGNHQATDFKDASLAFAEGYGTAVGGLLAGSPFYIDTKGVRQMTGGVMNLDRKTESGVRKGFYSEESVGYVMYQIGKTHGFPRFWNAVSSLRSGHESATIFAFLSRYVTANPGLSIASFLNDENIRSTDATGVLPSGMASDPAVSATASKGADDLERLYIPITLNNVAESTDWVRTSADAPTFCFNNLLPGALENNGLGMLKRFTFTAYFTGNMAVKVTTDAGVILKQQHYTVAVRDNTGTNVTVGDWENGGTATFAVVAGRKYTMRVSADDPKTIFRGNRCGHQITLWR